MEDFKSIYQNSYNYINDFIHHYEVQSVSSVEDLLQNYTDLYISKRKDDNGELIDHYFKFFGILKKKSNEKRPKTVSIFYFGKKKESELLNEYSTAELKKFYIRFELFSMHFHILKRFSEITKIEKKLDKVY